MYMHVTSNMVLIFLFFYHLSILANQNNLQNTNMPRIYIKYTVLDRLMLVVKKQLCNYNV